MQPSSNTIEKITMAGASDKGTVRAENEDFYSFSIQNKFFILCDGMGGHQKGAVASKMAAETIHDLITTSENSKKIVVKKCVTDLSGAYQDFDKPNQIPVLYLVAGTRLANRRIFSAAGHNRKLTGMGTTIAAVMFNEEQIFIVHVGDSRVYRFRNDKLSCLTTDHSWLNELLEDNEISEKDVSAFQNKNVLTRALGVSPSVKVDLQITTVQPNDLYLLCSDGMFNALPKEEIVGVLANTRSSLQDRVVELVKNAKLRDGSDNITGGLIHIGEKWLQRKETSNKKYALGNEPPRVSAYLDRCVRSIYLKTSNQRLKIAALASIVASLILLGWFLNKVSSG